MLTQSNPGKSNPQQPPFEHRRRWQWQVRVVPPFPGFCQPPILMVFRCEWTIRESCYESLRKPLLSNPSQEATPIFERIIYGHAADFVG